MNSFVYDVPTKVYFGENQLKKLGAELSKYGSRVLLTYGGGSIKKIGLYDAIVKEIKNAGLELFELSGIEPNPRIESVREGVEICKKEKIDVLLAVGGGSTIDATKFMAAGACVDFDSWDFFAKNAPIKEALPIVSILTLSATGTEMNGNAVVSNFETNDKIGRFSQLVYPRASFLDPTNTYTVNSYQTACGAVDIISHLIEIYFNMNQDLYMLDCFMEGMMKTVIKYAPIAMKDPENYEARANLMWASSWALNGFVVGGKRQAWSCHPMEHELSAYYDITHGLGLAILTPRWMRYCLDESNVSKYAQFGINVFGIDSKLPPMEIAKKAIELLEEFFFKTIELKSRFSEIGIDSSKFDIMSEKSVKLGQLSHAFKPLNREDVKNIFEMCL